MSTHGLFKFTDENGSFVVFRHHDSYPEGAADALMKGFYKAWTLPRFEADELAASFVACNKSNGGGIRLVNGPVENNDQEYVYDVFQAKNGQMIVKAYCNGIEFFYGRLKDFCLKYNPDDAPEIVKVFHGEFTDAENTAMEAKKSEIRRVVYEAIGKLNKINDELENIVTVGE